MDRAGLKIGLLAGLVGISCCVSPVVMVLVGLASVSFAISLGNTLYYQYGWYFRGAALVLAAAGVIGILRGRNACSLRGARSQWRLLLSVALAMAAAYVRFTGSPPISRARRPDALQVVQCGYLRLSSGSRWPASQVPSAGPTRRAAMAPSLSMAMVRGVPVKPKRLARNCTPCWSYFR